MALTSLALITTINVQAFLRKSEIIDSWSYSVVLKPLTGLCPINSVLLKNLWLVVFSLILFRLFSFFPTSPGDSQHFLLDSNKQIFILKDPGSISYQISAPVFLTVHGPVLKAHNSLTSKR